MVYTKESLMSAFRLLLPRFDDREIGVPMMSHLSEVAQIFFIHPNDMCPEKRLAFAVARDCLISLRDTGVVEYGDIDVRFGED